MDWSLVVVAIAVAVVCIASHCDSSSRIARIEHKLNLLLRHDGIDPGDRVPLSDRVREIAGDPTRKLEAIKLYREETGAGLAAAKEAIDGYMKH